MEPVIFGLPLSVAFLYFIAYSVLGWCMETVYCSVQAGHFVPRGFLYGPLCPIYGVGVLMMICWFQPLMDWPFLFYVAATVGMTSWEYFVGWFLETTTHVKYWDYSDKRFNIKGRVCLSIAMTWGILSYLVLYFIHPFVSAQLRRIPDIARYVLDGVFLGLLIADAGVTIYQLAKSSRLLSKLQQAKNELHFQFELERAELSDRLADAKAGLDEAAQLHRAELLSAKQARQDELVARTERLTRRFRARYRGLKVPDELSEALESINLHGELRKARLRKARQEKKVRKVQRKR